MMMMKTMTQGRRDSQGLLDYCTYATLTLGTLNTHFWLHPKESD